MSDVVQIQQLQIDSETKEKETTNDTDPKSNCNNNNSTTNNNPPNTNNTTNNNNKKTNVTSTRKRKLSSIEDIEMKDSNPPKKKRKKSRGWSPEEEKLFRSGLELYGRDWKKLSSHVGHNRTPASIRSHAQVYFLSMLKQGNILPNKILESGNGYTLSGKPLNKYSTAATRYFGGSENVPMVDGVISDEENKPKTRKKNTNNNCEKKKTNKKKANKKKKKRKNKYYDSDSDSDEDYSAVMSKNMTNSITNSTARRSGRNRRKVVFNEAPHISNPFGLRTDIQYYDEIVLNNEVNRKKNDYKIYAPFSIEYCPNALLIADIHSHLLRSVEIMGLLGGNYDINTKILYIKKCYPVKEEQHDEHTVAADSVDGLRVSELIREDGYELVGWYHSHPCFENVPSNLDCFQHSIQKYENENNNPYVGLIIQSLWERYDNYSNFKWFNTVPLNKGINDYEYLALQFITKEKINYDMNSEKLFQQIKQLIERYGDGKYDICRTNLGENGIDKRIFNNIYNKMDNMCDDNDDDNDNDQIQLFVKKIEKLFMEKKNIWWVTNTPKMNDDNTNVNHNNNNHNEKDDKENENCLN